jgi:hypothetical protein
LNAPSDAPTLSVAGGITTQSLGTINIAACIEMARTCGTGFSREGISRRTVESQAPANL